MRRRFWGPLLWRKKRDEIIMRRPGGVNGGDLVFKDMSSPRLKVPVSSCYTFLAVWRCMFQLETLIATCVYLRVVWDGKGLRV